MSIIQPFHVFVRIRQTPKNVNNILEVINPQTLKISNREMHFQNIFTENHTNQTVYSETLHKQMEKLFKGYNVTVLCYGTTGSGKTHTMFGNTEGQQGLVYQAIKELFTQKKQSICIKISFFEIYNEQVIDLLQNQNDNLSIKEDKNGDIQIPGLSQIFIVDEEQMIALIQQALQKRQLAPTTNNQHSSRSHAIVQINLINFDNNSNQKYEAKLILVDLAGSERCFLYKQLKVQQEGQNINKSLLALGQCIMMLNQNKQHIPYRNSKLTRILKQSLGGNSYTLFIACINTFSEETENTLKYAQKACAIKSQITQDCELLQQQSQRQYSLEIDNLQKQLNQFLLMNNGLHRNLKCLYTKINEDQETKIVVQNVEQQIATNMKQEKCIINQIKELLIEKENINNKNSVKSINQDIIKTQNTQIYKPIYLQIRHTRTNSQQLQESNKIPESKRFSNPFMQTMVNDESTILTDRKIKNRNIQYY